MSHSSALNRNVTVIGGVGVAMAIHLQRAGLGALHENFVKDFRALFNFTGAGYVLIVTKYHSMVNLQ